MKDKKPLIGNLAKWRRLVLERDKYQCQRCGLPHRDYFSIEKKLRPKMEAHHLIGIHIAPSLIFDLDNGQCLCLVCHKSKHKGTKE